MGRQRPRFATSSSSGSSRPNNRHETTSRHSSGYHGEGSQSGSASLASDRTVPVPWYGYIPYLGYHHVLMIIGAIPIILLCMGFLCTFDVFFLPRSIAMVLTGCASTVALHHLHLASFKYVDSLPSPSGLIVNSTLPIALFDLVKEESTGSAPIVEEVRVGYFSSCMRLNSGDWQCGLQSNDLKNISDPLGLVGTAQNFRTKTITPGLM